MNHVRRALGFVAFAVSLAQTWSSTAAAQGAASSRSAALLIGAGAGRYPFTPLPGARDSKPLSAMLTAGVEGEFADNWNWLQPVCSVESSPKHLSGSGSPSVPRCSTRTSMAPRWAPGCAWILVCCDA
jgi:hypothetical protein